MSALISRSTLGDPDGLAATLIAEGRVWLAENQHRIPDAPNWVAPGDGVAATVIHDTTLFGGITLTLDVRYAGEHKGRLRIEIPGRELAESDHTWRKWRGMFTAWLERTLLYRAKRRQWLLNGLSRRALTAGAPVRWSERKAITVTELP